MIDSHKIIYILPEVAYVAELLPGKKQHSYVIQTFRQINGDFLVDEEFSATNILKLFSKLEKDTYSIVLPDFLFTNTILSLTETADTKIKKYLSDELLPSLGISNETHLVDSSVLTQFKGISKVQLSAIEKSALAPLRAAATQYDIKISGVSPLSWTIKSIVSLEPSVTVLQIGSKVYTALQYIGVDQATIAPIDDISQVVETIKTLKGTEPSIQTVYLLGNAVLEEQLKSSLSSILPIQQLTLTGEDDLKMPSYVKQIIEAGMKTLTISDYPVPKFELGKASEEELSAFVAGNLDDSSDVDEDESTEEVSAALPTPSPLPTVGASLDDETDADAEAETEADVDTKADTEADATTDTDTISLDEEADDDLEIDTEADSETDADIDTEPTFLPEPEPELALEPPTPIVTLPPVHTPPIIASGATNSSANDTALESNVEPVSEPHAVMASTKPGDVDISQFAQHNTILPSQPAVAAAAQQPVIKNKSGAGNMVKMLFITLAVFVTTVAVGVGVGLGILTLTNKNSAETLSQSASPAPVASIEPSPSPSPSPLPEVKREDLSILIVNATNKAGYAGGFKTKLDAKKYESVKTGNAKGEYEAGNYVLMETEDQALIEALSEDTGLELEYQATGYETEDAAGTNDAVVVLAE